jgi:hypothetical protein
MGYYTDYTLEIEGDFIAEQKVKSERLLQEANKIQEKELRDVAKAHVRSQYRLLLEPEEWVAEMLEWGDPFIENCKWYDHTEDMLKISKEYPEFIFKLRGEGEENGDMWVKYYKNGRYQTCEAEIFYPPFDESKLQEFGFLI